MKIAILTRGSKDEGLGHLVRAQTFADTAQALHQVEIIAIAATELMPNAHCVADETEARRKLASIKADVIIYDVAVLERKTFDIAQAVAPVSASISPVFPYTSGLNMLFTRGETSDKTGEAKVYTGLSYAILNKDCTPIPADCFEATLNNSILSIGIAMGGGDSENHTLHVLQALASIEHPLSVRVFVGNGYSHPVDLLDQSLPARHELIVAKGGNIWEGLQDCAVGIFSSGLSILEAVYAGLPIIKITRESDASNAIQNTYDSLLLDGGRFADASYLKRLPVIIEKLQANREILRECRLRQQGLVDGRGAERVIQEIQRFCLAKKLSADNISL